jgi:hypothetical protein
MAASGAAVGASSSAFGPVWCGRIDALEGVQRIDPVLCAVVVVDDRWSTRIAGWRVAES